MELKVCEEKHKGLEEKINVYDTRLNNHAGRIVKLEQNQSRVDAKIDKDYKKRTYFKGQSKDHIRSFYFAEIKI